MATAGAFLLYVGITGSGIRGGLKALVGGKLPERKEPKGDALAKAETSLSAQGVMPNITGASAGGPRAKLAQAALKYVGVPYRWGGTTRAGMDCSGLVVLAFRDAYGVTPPRTTYVQVVWKKLRKIKNSEIAAGDVLFWPRIGPPSHVGIAVSTSEVVHAPKPGQKVKVVPINQAFTGGAAPVAMRYVGGGD